MKTVDPRTNTVWLDVAEFARKQNKQRVTIYKWCQSGFMIELGFLLQKDPTNHWRIGIPLAHQAYPQFS